MLTELYVNGQYSLMILDGCSCSIERNDSTIHTQEKNTIKELIENNNSYSRSTHD